MISLVVDGLKLLHSLAQISEELKENEHSLKTLLARTSIFEAFLLEKKQQSLGSSDPPSVQLALKQLVDLLREIEEFAQHYRKGGSFYGSVKRSACNLAHRSSRKQEMQKFEQRLLSCVSDLMPGLAVDIGQRREELLKAFELEMQEATGEILDELEKARSDTQRMLDLLGGLKKDIDSCDDASNRILQCVLQLERQMLQGLETPTLTELRASMQENAKIVVAAFQTELASCKQALQKIQAVDAKAEEMLAILKGRNKDELLRELELKPGVVKLETPRRTLGMGGFGVVDVGLYGTKRVAIKSLPISPYDSEKERDSVYREVLIMSHLQSPLPHPHVLQCFGFYVNTFGKKICLVLELAKHNSLADYLEDYELYPRTSLRLSLAWLYDLASALEHVHSKYVKHRNVKAQNILLVENYCAKLCDFGLMTNNLDASCTDYFRAPEIVSGQRSSFASDIYSLGVTFYQIYMRDVNLRSRRKCVVSDKIRKCFEEDIEKDAELSALDTSQKAIVCFFLRKLLLECTDGNPNNRPVSSHIVAMLEGLIHDLGGDPRLQEAFFSCKDSDAKVDSPSHFARAAEEKERGKETPSAGTSASASEVEGLGHFATAEEEERGKKTQTSGTSEVAIDVAASLVEDATSVESCSDCKTQQQTVSMDEGALARVIEVCDSLLLDAIYRRSAEARTQLQSIADGRPPASPFAVFTSEAILIGKACCMVLLYEDEGDLEQARIIGQDVFLPLYQLVSSSVSSWPLLYYFLGVSIVNELGSTAQSELGNCYKSRVECLDVQFHLGYYESLVTALMYFSG
eukprot:gene27572-33301_t